MSAFLDSMLVRAKGDLQTIVRPEGDDERTLQAAERILAEGVANLVILGDAAAIEASPYALDGARIVDVRTAAERAEFAAALYELRRHKGLTPEQAEALMDDVLYFGVMMVKQGLADGMGAGACHATGDVLRPSLQILKTAPGVKLVSSFFVMCVPDCDLGANGTFLFSDCGLEVQPDSERLAHIAVNSAKSWETLMGEEARVALLSHSTHGSAKNADAAKVVEATEIARELAPDLALDCSSTRPSSAPWARRRRPAPPWPAARTCSCSPTWTPATSATSSCSASPAPRRTAPSPRASPRR